MKNSTNTTNVVTQVGQNIGDGLKPLPIPNNNLVMIESVIPSNEKAEWQEIEKNESHDHHLSSFLLILALTISVALIIIGVQIYKTKKREELFRVNIETNEGYYLITD
jgi:hypothetical protein